VNAYKQTFFKMQLTVFLLILYERDYPIGLGFPVSKFRIWWEKEKSFPKTAKVSTGQNCRSWLFLKAPELLFVCMHLYFFGVFCYNISILTQNLLCLH